MVKIDFDLIADTCEAYGLEAHIDRAAYGFGECILGMPVVGAPVNIWRDDDILWSGVIETDEDLNEALSYCN